MKACKDCSGEKPLIEFPLSKRDGYLPRCRPCHNIRQRERWHADPVRHRYYGARWKRENPGKQWDHQLWYNYRLTAEQYDAMLADQGGGCFVCGSPDERGRRLSVHHDHACCPGKRSCGSCVVALLCGDCNRAEGLLRSNVHSVRRLLDLLLVGQTGLTL